MNAPTLEDVYAARERVYRVLRPTPLIRHPLLAAETGLDISVKHENTTRPARSKCAAG